MVRIAQPCTVILIGSLAASCSSSKVPAAGAGDAAIAPDVPAAVTDRSGPNIPESGAAAADLGPVVADLRPAEEGLAPIDAGPAEPSAHADSAVATPGRPDSSPAVDSSSIEGGLGADTVDARDVPEAESADLTPADGSGASSSFRILIFSKTAGFRHASIPTAVEALMSLQSTGGYQAEATEDAGAFTAANLMRFQVVVFALTSGDVLDDAQQAAFESWVAAGGGTVGIHSASDTEYDWAFYGDLIGAYFKEHPAIQMATVRVEATDHPIMAAVPTSWVRTDEWYAFVTNPRPRVTVLATVDEATYAGGTMGSDHPIIWAHMTVGGARSFYTALGHTPESYAEAPFRQHLVNGIRWAAGR